MPILISRLILVNCGCEELAQGFSSSNDVMSYSGSNTLIDITTDERNKQFIIEKLHNNIELKDNTNKNHTIDNKKVTEKFRK